MGPLHTSCVVLWLELLCSVQTLERVEIRRLPAPAPAEGPGNSTQLWFSQQLDHFIPIDDTQWSQRYWVNADYYHRGAPVFLYVGGEREQTGLTSDLGEHWEQNAILHKALMFKVEHRFYGESQPTGGNLTLDDLLYLSIDQALADLADFIVAMNRQYALPVGTQWVAFGCSYSGSLAAWLRYKYPHLVYAAVASSANLLAKINFPEYYNHIGEALVKFYGDVKNNETLGRKCYEDFKKANEEIDELIKTPEGTNLTIEYFQLAEAFDHEIYNTFHEYNTAYIFGFLSLHVSVNVQYNTYNETSGNWNIERICDVLTNESLGSPVRRYAQTFNNLLLEADPTEQSDRQWYYQICTEIGGFITSEDEISLLGNHISLEYYFDSCMEEFGETFTETLVRRGVDRTNTVYGGLEIDATRVIYTHGTLDPWISLGLNRTRTPLSPVIVIEGASHCADMKPFTDHDSAAMRAARSNISAILRKWLEPSEHRVITEYNKDTSTQMAANDHESP